VIRKLFSVILTGMVLAIGACSAPMPTAQTAATAQATVAAQPSTETAYPGSPTGTSQPQGYPGSTLEDTPGPSTTPPPSPTIDPQLGIASGTIELKGQPVAKVAMYLGQLLKDSTGRDSVVALDLKASPWAPTDSSGHFRIVNVAPGKYGLVLVTVTASYHLLYPDKSQSVVLTIEAGREVDLGTLNYLLLPIPSP
jgi:hypothetical protein